MLNEKGVAFDRREYMKNPLSEAEIRSVLEKLGLGPHDVLRRRDKAFKELGLDGSESDDTLIAHMAQHPGLLQRPIGVVGDRAVVGRPAEALLTLT